MLYNTINTEVGFCKQASLFGEKAPEPNTGIGSTIGALAGGALGGGGAVAATPSALLRLGTTDWTKYPKLAKVMQKLMKTPGRAAATTGVAGALASLLGGGLGADLGSDIETLARK